MARKRAAAFAGALVAAGVAVGIAAAVQTGRLAHFDQYSVYHLMPWLEPTHHTSRWHFAVPEKRVSRWGTLVALVTYPASILVSALIVLACAAVLWSRGRRRSAAEVCVLMVWANVIAYLGKATITRETLHAGFRKHGLTHGFDHSVPSGHAIRAVVVAFGLAQLGRAGRVAWLWALAVPVALVAIGDHTPSDVVCGFAVGVALVLARRVLRR